jgi:hypothetical protein
MPDGRILCLGEHSFRWAWKAKEKSKGSGAGFQFHRVSALDRNQRRNCSNCGDMVTFPFRFPRNATSLATRALREIQAGIRRQQEIAGLCDAQNRQIYPAERGEKLPVRTGDFGVGSGSAENGKQNVAARVEIGEELVAKCVCRLRTTTRI